MNQHLQPLQDYYGWRLERGGNSSVQLGWEDPVAHYERFRVLTNELDVNYRSLLDVGSGLGDLWYHLSANGLLVRYLGVDILPEMVHRARERFPGVDFECRDVIGDPDSAGGRFDIVYSAGIFNLAATASEAFLRRAFDAFTGLAERHVALSLLHAGSPGREEQYRYYDPAATAAALSRPGWELRTVEGYLRNDFTIIASHLD
jgi:hypothetical protein